MQIYESFEKMSQFTYQMRFVFIEKQHLGGIQNALFFVKYQNAHCQKTAFVIDDRAVADSGNYVGIFVGGVYKQLS